jgi:hypothetical protein
MPIQAERTGEGIFPTQSQPGSRCMVSITFLPPYLQEIPGTHCIGGWVGWGTVWTSRKTSPPAGFDPQTVWAVESRFTNWAFPVAFCMTTLTSNCTFYSYHSFVYFHSIHVFQQMTPTRYSLVLCDFITFQVAGYHNGADEVSSTLRGYAVPTGNYLPTFRSMVMATPSGSFSLKNANAHDAVPWRSWLFMLKYLAITTSFNLYFCTIYIWGAESRIPIGGEIFRTRPDSPWGPSSLLHNRYRVFPEVKRPGRGIDHPPNVAPRLRKE